MYNISLVWTPTGRIRKSRTDNQNIDKISFFVHSYGVKAPVVIRLDKVLSVVVE